MTEENMEKFRDIEYKRPKAGRLVCTLLSYEKKFRKAASFEEADEIFMKFHETAFEAATMYVTADIRNTMNTADAFYDREMKFFNTVLPMLAPVLKKCVGTLIKSRYRGEFEEKYGSHLFKNAEIQMSLFKAGIILPTVRENNLSTRYSKTAAGCSVDFMGEKCNFYGLLRHMESTDRAERKAAFEEWAKLYESIAPQLEKQYGEFISVRLKIASKLSYGSYIDYAYKSRGRYDYTPADVAVFREAVRKYITPLCESMYEEQRRSLGIDKLHWYDEKLVFPEGNAVPQGTTDELVEKAARMYADMSPETGEFFAFMKEHELFDLETRENKHLGGYCTTLLGPKAPFIFSNFNGTSADVDVLTHEAGHAFQFYYASRRLPVAELAGSTSEINEIHSMSMEHFAYPYMESFFGDKADKYRYSHFCSAFKSIPYLVAVDEYQHRVFENPSSGPADWRVFWKEIEGKYMPWRDYDGNAFLESGGFWMQKQHIFLYPFYYIDYALAQLCAFYLYRLEVNGENALERYFNLCALGGKYGYFETLGRAGIPVPLSEEAVKNAADFVKEHSEVLKSRITR